MKTRKIIFTLAALTAISAVIADDTDYQVAASFERELSHQPSQSVPATRNEIDKDVLYRLINKPLQTAEAADSTPELQADSSTESAATAEGGD